ncbi:MAG: Na+/H+ antiporter subunit C [Tibeticola sp.]
MTWVVVAGFWVSLVAGVYLVTSRDVLRVVVGLGLLGSAVNLALLASGRFASFRPALVAAGAQALDAAANPVPQALVLTAIVIGFALLCFSLVLVLALVRRTGTDDVRGLPFAEPAPTDPVKPPFSDDERVGDAP